MAEKKIKALLVIILFLFPVAASAQFRLEVVGTYSSGLFAEGGAEIGAYDPPTKRLFVVNGGRATLDILDIQDPRNPQKVRSIQFSRFGGSANSVAIHDGIVAVAIQADEKTDMGFVAFYNTQGNFLKSVRAGALPDMLTFTPDGKKVLVANEGEPNDEYTVDPEGSITIIDVSGGIASLTQSDVRTAAFTSFNKATLDSRIRVYGPGATVAQDFEPEYIAVSPDSETAWVTLQENNALAVVDIESATVTKLIALGTKSHGKKGKDWMQAMKTDASIFVISLFKECICRTL